MGRVLFLPRKPFQSARKIRAEKRYARFHEYTDSAENGGERFYLLALLRAQQLHEKARYSRYRDTQLSLCYQRLRHAFLPKRYLAGYDVPFSAAAALAGKASRRLASMVYTRDGVDDGCKLLHRLHGGGFPAAAGGRLPAACGEG